MPRNNKNTKKRRFDTRASFGELSKLLGLSPKQRIIMRRYMIEKMKGGGQEDRN